MDFKLVTFNIRYLYDGDGINSYIHRSAIIRNKIKAEKPDVIGFQEVTSDILNDLTERMPDYDIFFSGRDADFSSEGLAIALRKQTAELMGLDVFWLSKTPYVAGSRYENQSMCPRICQQTLVKMKGSSKTCWIFNNHFDHCQDDRVRMLEIRQVLDRAAACKDRWKAPLFIMGDFNVLPESGVIQYCNGYQPVKIADLTAESGPTFHGFGKAKMLKKIDYIFSDLAFEKSKCKIKCWNDEFNGIYLSDHYPVCVSLEI